MDWARERLPSLFSALSESDPGKRCPLVMGWNDVRNVLEAGGEGGWTRGFFGGAGWAAARKRLTEEAHLDDFDQLTGFWPRERTMLIEEAIRATLETRSAPEEDTGIGL